MRRKLTLTVAVILLAVSGVAATGQTAQASTRNVLVHPSYLVRDLLCIHSYEGSWTDPGSPYWGGLQMDLSFQETYGWIRRGKVKWSFLRHWGTADNWPVWAQVVAGLHGYFSRGWNPWPNTARYCGLM